LYSSSVITIACFRSSQDDDIILGDNLVENVPSRTETTSMRTDATQTGHLQRGAPLFRTMAQAV
jgi:hypothetical protein